MVSALPWDADKARPDGLASMDVLMAWLQRDNNTSHWQNGRRPALCDEIVVKLKEQGITTRSAGAVHTKLWLLDKQFATAKAWLAVRGLTFSDADDKAKLRVLRLCHHYLALVPLPRATTGGPKGRQCRPISSESSAETSSDDEDKENEDDEDAEVKTLDENAKSSLRKSLSTLKPGQPPTRKRGFVAERRSSELLSDLVKRARVPGSLGKLEQEAIHYVHAVTADLKAEELTQRRQLFKYELQVMRAHAVCETILAKKKLLVAGAPRDEVERTLSL